MEKITGLVICRNEEKNIGDCLQSIQWCDEIIVVDAFSEDATVQIAEKYTHRIHLREWGGFKAQREFALGKVEGGWVFSLDADERCTPELSREIKNTLVNPDSDIEGYMIPRKSYFMNKWIKHGGWYPDRQLRLFKAGSATVTDRLVHESFSVQGKKSNLTSDILHYTASSVDDYMKKILRYSELSALEKKNSRVGFYRLVIYPRLEFVKQYFIKGNFLDGKEGLAVANLHMITKLLTYLRVLEMQKK